MTSIKEEELKKEIKIILDKWKEKHELNLKNIGGWDSNDFLDYSKELLKAGIEQGIQEGKKEVIDFIKTKKIVYNSNVTPPIYEYQLTEEDLKKIEEKK